MPTKTTWRSRRYDRCETPRARAALVLPTFDALEPPKGAILDLRLLGASDALLRDWSRFDQMVALIEQRNSIAQEDRSDSGLLVSN